MSPTRRPKSSNGIIVVLAVILILGLIYTFTGSDPLGLFSPIETATPVQVQKPATKTPKPGVTPKITEPPVDAPTAVPAITSVPSAKTWWNVYFVSPQRVRQADEEKFGVEGLPPELLKGSIAEALIKHIDSAKKTIHIASFETDIVDVAKALIRAKQRGVEVRWITDDESGLEADTKPGHGQFALMKKAKIEIIDDGRAALMHNKFWIFDGKTVWTGSTNVTISGMFEQDNNVIVINSPELAAMYERQFADMWSGKFNSKAPSTADQQRLTIDETEIQVLFSPEDKAISKIVPYVQGAKKSIRFMAFSFTQPELGDAMLAAAKRKVSVSGVFETVGADSEYGELSPMACAKIPVRIDGNYAFLHHKVIIIDERIVITGSLNFSDNADQSNNENVLIIDNPDIAKLYTAEFERVWSVGAEQDAAKIQCK